MIDSLQPAGAPEAVAYIGLGSNLDHPEDQVRQAFLELAALPGSHIVACSGLYRSRPLGPQDQPPYINAVAVLETVLSPQRLLAALQGIESAHGRVRTEQRWGPRPLDLDLLLYGALECHTERLTVPHPGLPQRDFVLYPLLEVAGGDLRIPRLGSLQSLVAQCPSRGLERLQDDVQR